MKKTHTLGYPHIRVFLSLVCAFSAAFNLTAQDDDDQLHELEAFIVRPIESGTEAELAAQRASGTFSTIVSEETLGYLPDQSVGEALSRLAGISITKDRGEAQNITIRGAASRLNAVTLNGDRIPSPDDAAEDDIRGERRANLQSVPATLISGIEVTKAVRPDQDADSIGGIVELKTKRATDLDGPLFNSQVRYGYNQLPSEDLKSFEFTYGNRFGQDGEFGYIVSASWEENNRGSEELQYSWDDIDELRALDPDDDDIDLGGDMWVVEDADIIWRDIKRTRQGVNLAFDWKASETASFRLGGFFNEFNDQGLRRRLQIRHGSSSDFVEGTTFFDNGIVEHAEVDGGRVRHRIRSGQKDTTTYNLHFEGEHIFADWNVKYRASFTSSEWELNRTRTRWEFRTSDGGDDLDDEDGIVDLRYDNVGDVFNFENPTGWVRDASVAEFGNRGDYQRREGDLSVDEIWSYSIDFERFFTLGNGELRVKTGYKARMNDRDIDNRLTVFERPDGSPDLFMSEFLGANQRTPVDPFGIDNGPWPEQALFDQFFLDNPSLFEVDETNRGRDYTTDEDIDAFYLMGTYTEGPFRLIAGARYEDTSNVSTGFAVFDGDDDDRELVTAERSYDNWLPAIILRYNLTDDVVLRAAWTNTLGRPNFNDLAPTFEVTPEVDEADGDDPATASLEISGGNPDLQPFESENFDLGVEYYFGKTGVISVGLFQKTIENFEYLEIIDENDIAVADLPEDLRRFAPAGFDTLESFNYTTARNGDESRLEGIEISYRQQLEFLPDGLDNLGVLANYTKVEGESDITEGITRDFLIGQFDYVYNAQLYYEVDRFTARLAYNYNGELFTSIAATIDEGDIDDNPEEDLGNDSEETWDFSFQYRLPGDESRWSFNFDVKNVFDQVAARRFEGSVGPRRIVELESGGRSFLFGVNYEM